MSESTAISDGGIEASNVDARDVSPTEYARRVVAVDFLFLDRESCARCAGTEDSLEAALDLVAGVLSDLDVGVDLRRVHVDDATAARLTGLEVSPTVRVNGRDVQSAYRASPCESCGDLCGCAGDVDCRVWTYRGEEYDVAPVGLLAEAVLRAAAAPRESAESAEVTPLETTGRDLSEPIQRFFGKDTDNCGGGRCGGETGGSGRKEGE